MKVACFVKTPGLSPIKTRLAAGIGTIAAAEFYDLACAAVAEVMASGSACWAVAEVAGLSRWPQFPTVLQGEGALGDRLSRVYEALRQPRGVALIGADAPQITAQLLADAQRLLTSTDFVLGPASDGGFYLFAGRKPIPASVWTAVPYSVPETAQRLTEALAPLGTLARLPTLTDVDEAKDLVALGRELRHVPLLPAKQRLAAWLAASAVPA